MRRFFFAFLAALLLLPAPADAAKHHRKHHVVVVVKPIVVRGHPLLRRGLKPSLLINTPTNLFAAVVRCTASCTSTFGSSSISLSNITVNVGDLVIIWAGGAGNTTVTNMQDSVANPYTCGPLIQTAATTPSFKVCYSVVQTQIVAGSTFFQATMTGSGFNQAMDGIAVTGGGGTSATPWAIDINLTPLQCSSSCGQPTVLNSGVLNHAVEILLGFFTGGSPSNTADATWTAAGAGGNSFATTPKYYAAYKIVAATTSVPFSPNPSSNVGNVITISSYYPVSASANGSPNKLLQGVGAY